MVGIERIAVIINRCAIYEALYLTNGDASRKTPAENGLMEALISLYANILKVLYRIITLYTEHKASK